MYIAVFLEITEKKEPRYLDAFLKTDAPVIISKEYADKMSADQDKNLVHVIPTEIMDAVDQGVEDIKDRETLLAIQKNGELEKWLEDTINQFKDKQDVEGILLNGPYYSVKAVAKKLDIEVFVATAKSNLNNSDAKDTYYQNKIELLQNNLDVINERYVNLNESYASLREYITSTENYVKELQAHATKLDDSLKAAVAEKEEAVQKAAQLDQIKEENRITLKMYKDVMKELDERRTEVLELKSRRR